jgi:hypothetical protein
MLMRNDDGSDVAPVFGSVAAPLWDGRPAIIVGTGPSLKGFDLSRLNGLGWVLACKESMFDLPFADAIFGLDLPWMRVRHDYLAERALACEVYLSAPEQKLHLFRTVPGAIYLKRLRNADTFTMDPEAIECGGNSGFGAINLALLKRAREIYLFGFDYTSGHYNQPRYDEREAWGAASMNYFPRWAKTFDATVDQLRRLNVKIWNASPDSNLTAYERISNESALDRLRGLGSPRG